MRNVRTPRRDRRAVLLTLAPHDETYPTSDELRELRLRSEPIAGRDGWRRTLEGREFYSSEWLGVLS
jgi:hypothetical protein